MTTQTIDEQSDAIHEILEEESLEQGAENTQIPQEAPAAPAGPQEMLSAPESEGPHVDASDLDQAMLKDVVERTPNEQEELDETAEELGL
jgi:hypothetical protein